jgi:hypothetical protein
MKNFPRALVVVAASMFVVSCQKFRPMGADDEAPIRVRGGSLDLNVNEGSLEPVGSASDRKVFKYKPPAGKIHKGNLWALAILDGATGPNYCYSNKLDGLDIVYSDDFKVTFSVETQQTKLVASNDFDAVTSTQLTHSASGYFKYVTIVGNNAKWNCQGGVGAIKEVRVCSADSRGECKDPTK